MVLQQNHGCCRTSRTCRRCYFDFSSTYVGVGMIFPYIINGSAAEPDHGSALVLLLQQNQTMAAAIEPEPWNHCRTMVLLENHGMVLQQNHATEPCHGSAAEPDHGFAAEPDHAMNGEVNDAEIGHWRRRRGHWPLEKTKRRRASIRASALGQGVNSCFSVRERRRFVLQR
ncbi:putative metal-nicotianamine transporter YSL8 [Senna tora]|uniref:Putative metal-nicotianamine transporter YSL8 n=1 Tax=Senna tora TaxID=362788 RepID=A0A835C4V5_9FABA|nr:putative metal-nicotianamine transporter YSL8 [Senna tora]